MCGINGLFDYGDVGDPEARRAELLATRDYMAARGPDGFGEWWNAAGTLGFGHRRLAIVDLSDGGKQPMVSDDQTAIVTFNGEIYNYPELRAQLEGQGVVFRSDSDTEVLLHLYRRHGDDMVQHLRGMFAFAIWDARAQGLFLARDPYGIKPLYTSDTGGVFRFASQVKALVAGGAIPRAPCPAGVVSFCLWGSVAEPFTLYRDIDSLPAGTTQWVDRNGPRQPKSYFRIAEIFAAGSRRHVPDAVARDIVRDAMTESVRAHLMADVDVGVFLSGGVDSSAMLGLMRDAGQSRIKAITLAFDEFLGTPRDEAPQAAITAELYGAAHRVRRVGEAEFRGLLPDILRTMDQPTIDGVNVWLVSMAAREAGLKVALSGVGADEILGGYPSFRQIPRWVRWMAAPASVPKLGVMARRLLLHAAPMLERPKLAAMIEYGGTYSGAYLLRRGIFLPFELEAILDEDFVVQGLAQLMPLRRLRDEALRPLPATAMACVASLESCQYLRNQLLRDADWAGMAHSVEIRTPFVDVRMLQRLGPVISSLNAQSGKLALSSAPRTPLPDAITHRAKTGFTIPTERWLGQETSINGKLGLASRSWTKRLLDNVKYDLMDKGMSHARPREDASPDIALTGQPDAIKSKLLL